MGFIRNTFAFLLGLHVANVLDLLNSQQSAYFKQYAESWVEQMEWVVGSEKDSDIEFLFFMIFTYNVLKTENIMSTLKVNHVGVKIIILGLQSLAYLFFCK